METRSNPLRRQLRPRAVLITLSAAFVAALGIEWGAYETGVRAEARATARRELPANYCVKCHSDPKTVSMMLMKDDNNGTAAYCAGIALPSRQQPTGRAPSDKAPAGAITQPPAVK
jgi:hypothetical protein